MEQTAETVATMTAAQRADYYKRQMEQWRDAYLAVLAGVEAARAVAPSPAG